MPRATFLSPWKSSHIDFHRELFRTDSQARKKCIKGALSLNHLELHRSRGGIAFPGSENLRTFFEQRCCELKINQKLRIAARKGTVIRLSCQSCHELALCFMNLLRSEEIGQPCTIDCDWVILRALYMK